MDELKKAGEIHRRIPLALKRSPIVLRYTASEIRHHLPSPNWINGTQATKAVPRNHHIDAFEMKELVDSVIARGRFFKRWCAYADHALLLEMIGKGCLPQSWYAEEFLGSPASHSDSYLEASKRGCLVLERLTSSKSPTSGEVELWYAAHQIWSGAFRPFCSDSFDWAWRDTVVQIQPQFIVPNQTRRNGIPYAIDQLWVVRVARTEVRLIALESDGELHQAYKEQRRDQARDSALSKLGYDVVRVAGWWANVDPYRVICEFLSVSGISPNASRTCSGCDLSTINDYKCCVCRLPMVRWDTNWILGLVDEDDQFSGYAHRCCADRSN